MKLSRLHKWVSQIFHEGGPAEHSLGAGDAEQHEPDAAARTLILTTPVEHNSLASLSSHIAATAKGEIFTTAPHTEHYAE